MKKKMGDDLMPDPKLSAVLDDDLKQLLESLGELSMIENNEVNCAYCKRKITLGNIHAIFSRDNKIVYCCDNPDCITKMVWSDNING